MYWNITDEARLIEAFKIASLNALTQIFLDDLLTKKEIQNCVMRLKAACMLRDGATYKEIEEFTEFTSITISKIAKIMKDKEGGFQKVLYKMNPDNEGYFE